MSPIGLNDLVNIVGAKTTYTLAYIPGEKKEANLMLNLGNKILEGGKIASIIIQIDVQRKVPCC